MKYEKPFKAYKFFFLFCPFTSNLFVNVKLHSAPKEMYQSLLNFFSKNPALIWGRSLKR